MKNLAVTTGRLVTLISAILLLVNQGILSGMKSPIVKSATLSSSRAITGESEKTRVRQAFANLPLCFVENRGQVDRSVAYYVQSNDRTIYFTAQGLTFSLTGNPNAKSALDECLTNSSEASHFAVAANQTSQRWTLKLDFVGANPRAKLKAAEPYAASANYFRGARSQWQTGLKTYRSLVYENLWPGIDLLYAGAANQLKYTFIVKPGADANQIKLSYRGATNVKINSEGQLEVTTPVSSLNDERPISYQEISGRRVPVDTAFTLDANTGGDPTYGFRVGEYDRRQPLVIDPAVFIYSGYLGGTNNDPAFKIALDTAGNAYVTGMTSSQVTFPKTVGPDLSYNGNFFDAFVSKINAAGTALVYCGYIGGTGNDMGFSIAVDTAGNAYVTGSTTSPASTFPVTGGPGLVYQGGTFFGDAFVAKVRADGTGLIYCGYIGGSNDDVGLDIAVDPSGNAYVTGQTASSESSFPVTVGPDLTFNGGSHDAFVAKVNQAGNALSYCGYIGGAAGDTGNGIAVDSAGNAYVAGSTASSETSFPVAVGPDLTYNSGGDGFIAKVNTAGTALLFCGYIGGSNQDQCSQVAVDNAGNIYVTGFTLSDETTFPVTVGPDLTFNGGTTYGDAYVAKVSASGAALIYCGYIGGSGEDAGADIAVDSGSNAYITGATTSTEASFPIKGGANGIYQGGSEWGDAFVAKVNAAGSLTFATYIGGAGDDGGTGIAVDQFGYAYIAGGTQSSPVTFPVVGGPDLTYNSGQDSFVSKLVVITLSSQSVSFTASGGAGSISLETPNNYNWTATSNDGFITITSGSSGTGNGTINYSVAVNTSSSARQGTMTIAGQTVTVMQDACATAAVSSQPTNQTACAGAAASFTVTVTGTNPTYQWRKGGVNLSNGGNISGATSATLTINPAGAGDAGSYDVVVTGSCGNASSNSATLTVNSYSLSAMSQGFPAAGGASSVNVIVAGSCPWTAVSNDSWITVTGGTPGSGNGTVSYSVASNSGAARSGTMTIAGLTFTVNQSSPTLVRLISFTATGYDNGTFLQWQTGLEADNLGFNLYRDDGGKRTPVNNQVIAGSALRDGVALSAGEVYTWWDSQSSKSASYWLEDVDLNGNTTMHGPFSPKYVGGSTPPLSQASLLTRLGSRSLQDGATRLVETVATATQPTAESEKHQAELSQQSAIKIGIKKEGWYHLSQRELVAAGFSKDINPQLLQLFVDGREIPIAVLTGKENHFDENSAIEFYGIGLDTPSTDMRTYWLIAGNRLGRRIAQTKGEGVSSLSSSFTQTVERKDRSLYFAALLNGDKENFFGAVVTATPVEQALEVQHLAPGALQQASVEVTLQGVTIVPHRALVQVNGSSIGEVIFSGQENKTAKFLAQQSLLREGTNLIRLISQNGSADVSLVDSIRIAYQHTYEADSDLLKAKVNGGEAITLTNFSTGKVRVFDISNADTPQELLGKITEERNGYSITVVPQERGERTVLALADPLVKQPVSLLANLPSTLRDTNNQADFVILSPRQFFTTLEPLRQARQAEGYKTAVIDTEDIYDEFNFGHKSPQSIRDFLAYTKTNWKTSPRFVLLVGDASYDAKNYLGLGEFDLLPTKLLDTTYLETASDDWFADFTNDGIPEMAIGRLPVRDVEEATALVAKILRYNQAKTPQSALLVSDKNDGFNFEQANTTIRSLLEPNLKIEEVRRSQFDDATAKARLLESLNRGQRFVNYVGHGSVNLWRGNLLTGTDARVLSNEALPVFVTMNCLNGYFQEATTDSLSEALLKADIGGAIAVWASSGLTLPNEQALVDQQFYRLLFDEKLGSLTIGEAAARAKTATNNSDVRRTWILLGDPTTRVK